MTAMGGGSVSDHDSRKARDGHVDGEGAGRGRVERRGQGACREETTRKQNSKRHCLSSTHCVPDHMHHMCYLTFLQLH